MELQDAYCTICREDVTDYGGRAKLQCGHHFHMDCIFQEFSTKGAMQCPNCRNVEMSRWPFPNNPRPSNELNVDGLVSRGDVMSQSIYPEVPQFQSEGVARGRANAVLELLSGGFSYRGSLANQTYPYQEEPAFSSSGGLYSFGSLVNDPYLYLDRAARATSATEGLGSHASLMNQPYPYSTTHAEGHARSSSNHPQFQFAGFNQVDAAAAALESFTSYLNSGASLRNPHHHPYLEVPAISSTRGVNSPGSLTNPLYAYPEQPAVASTRVIASHGSLMTQPYRDSATRAELRSQNLNAYILGARNQGHAGSSSNQPLGRGRDMVQ